MPVACFARQGGPCSGGARFGQAGALLLRGDLFATCLGHVTPALHASPCCAATAALRTLPFSRARRVTTTTPQSAM